MGTKRPQGNDFLRNRLIDLIFSVNGVVTRLDVIIQEIHKDYIQQQEIKLDESLSIKVFDGEVFFNLSY
jgi:hypothetical protein